MKPLKPISTLELFPPLSEELLALLRRLPLRDWDSPTLCAGWSVKDVCAHLLGGSLGRLQDGQTKDDSQQAAPLTFAELVDWIDRSNAEWVTAARRISPSLMIEFLELTDQRLYHYFKTLVMNEQARIPVSWAGDQQSPNWFDVAREYTEKWLHQQHIREAVGQPLLTENVWLHPVLDTFMRALPFTYRELHAVDGTIISFTLAGEAGGQWSLLRQDAKWCLFSGASSQALSHVTMDQDTAWRLFTRGMDSHLAQSLIKMEGSQEMGAGILKMVSIMA